MKSKLTLLLAAMLLSTVAAYAHHSFAATYFEGKTAKVEGKIIQFLFRNPHSFAHLDVPDAGGRK